MLTKQLPITRETKKLRNMVMRFVANYPKMFKYTLGKRMVQTVLDLNKYIRRANEETDKARRWRYICEVRYLIEDMEDLVDCSVEFKAISTNQQTQIAVVLESLGKQATGWKLSTEKFLK